MEACILSNESILLIFYGSNGFDVNQRWERPSNLLSGTSPKARIWNGTGLYECTWQKWSKYKLKGGWAPSFLNTSMHFFQQDNTRPYSGHLQSHSWGKRRYGFGLTFLQTSVFFFAPNFLQLGVCTVFCATVMLLSVREAFFSTTV